MEGRTGLINRETMRCQGFAAAARRERVLARFPSRFSRDSIHFLIEPSSDGSGNARGKTGLRTEFLRFRTEIFLNIPVYRYRLIVSIRIREPNHEKDRSHHQTFQAGRR